MCFTYDMNGMLIIYTSHIYRIIKHILQVALLAPTRILALQHLRVLTSRMPGVK